MSTTYININGDVRDVSSLNVPSDRVFRDAWEFNGDAIEVDMSLAKEIHKDTLRMERAPMLEAMDVEFMQALEQGADTSSIIKKKVVLRGITKDTRIELAKTPEELKALDIVTLIGS